MGSDIYNTPPSYIFVGIYMQYIPRNMHELWKV